MSIFSPGRRVFIVFVLAACLGAAALLGQITWLLWKESVSAEEARVAELAQQLGQRAEQMIVEARALLDKFNNSELPRCSDAHISAMHEAAIGRPYIRAMGYWRATERVCGVGYIQAVKLQPSRADRIYESGVIAWWPSSQTEVGGVQMFLMRYGDHDVAIDPRMLLQPVEDPGRQAGLWVENLPMATTGDPSSIPEPDTLELGLTLDSVNNRVLSRFTLGKIFPMDIVAVETIERFWSRYLPFLAMALAVALILAAVWVYLVLRFSRSRMSLSAELRNAISNGNITAFYQPILELSTGRCIGAEALARWIRPDGEMVRPDVFIPLAEQDGLVPEITMAVLAATLKDLGDILREHPLLKININLAPEDLGDEVFKQRLRDLLVNAAVAPQCITLEITERAMVNTDRSRQQVRELRDRGHEIAVDDFGTGYSSLSYLQDFELDTLKIDKSFIDAVGTEAVTHNVVGHVIEMAGSLELNTVAEGIETPDQADWLIDQGVAYGQGFLYSKPIPAEPFRAYLQANLQRHTRDLKAEAEAALA
ncbi:MAG: EAL domain-containing protein [Halieaceae bacterium]|nr:EAL domain-containing protein [Halieaceae bacterium]